MNEPTAGSLAGDHQKVQATINAMISTKQPVPSRRCSTGITTSGPILRTAPPNGVASADQNRVMARTTHGWVVPVTLSGVGSVIAAVFFDFELDFCIDDRSVDVRVAIPSRLPLLGRLGRIIAGIAYNVMLR